MKNFGYNPPPKDEQRPTKPTPTPPKKEPKIIIVKIKGE